MITGETELKNINKIARELSEVTCFGVRCGSGKCPLYLNNVVGLDGIFCISNYLRTKVNIE